MEGINRKYLFLASNDKVRFFIDRDPKYFGAILNFLRDGKLRPTDIEDFDGFIEEFRFYRIPEPNFASSPVTSVRNGVSIGKNTHS